MTEWCVTDEDGQFWEIIAPSREDAAMYVAGSGCATGRVTVQTVAEFYNLDAD